jgi:ATP/ADP translocase
VSNLSLQRPARELLHLQSSIVTPYGTKNFIDTTIYRLGDVLAAWAIGMMLTAGFQLEQVALYLLPVTLLWLIIGYTISKNIKLTTA